MSEEKRGERRGPLHGVRVLDLSMLVFGPFSTLILADMGADVIKIESPEGDPGRKNPPSRSPGMGASFLNNNRNKRSVALDLKQAEGREALLALAKTADVLVYNIRPDAMARLKLGYDDLKAVNPQIIYVGAMGFGQRGRYAKRPAYDDMVQGMAGLPAFAARASGGEPRYSPYAYADRLAAVFVSNAVLGALYHRSATGEGQRVDVPMFEHVVYTLLGEHLSGETFVPARGSMGHGRSMARDRRPYRTKDGYLCTLIYNDRQWRSFFEMIGEAERYDSDERFSSQANRMKNLDFVFGYLADVLQTKTTAEWTQAFMAHDLPVGPMNEPEEVLRDPHLADTGFFREIEHPSEGKVRTMHLPVDYSRTPLATRYPAPRLGEHTVELLTEAGYDRARIDDLVARRIAIVS